MGIYGSFKYGHIFKKTDLTEEQLQIMSEMSELFSVGNYTDYITLSDKKVCIDNSGLGIEMREANGKTLIVQTSIGWHKSENGVIMKEYKTQKYYYDSEEYDDISRCSKNNCSYCYDHNSYSPDNSSKKISNESIENDFASRGISVKPIHFGWFNVVFCSVDLSSKIYIPLKENE